MSGLALRRCHLTYAGLLEPRRADTIDLAVIHCTELPDLATARAYGERVVYPRPSSGPDFDSDPGSGTGNSGHFYIERNGSIEEWVPMERIAHHVRGFNERSVGIELVNIGRFPEWFDSRRQVMGEPYPAAQVEALAQLLGQLSTLLPNLRWIAGHDALDQGYVAATDDPALRVRRKLDPGPLFPWNHLMGAVPLARFNPGLAG
ncbi:MAG: N-acetylmuramoyl-L-alanine amidase [Lysobacterales bacterium]